MIWLGIVARGFYKEQLQTLLSPTVNWPAAFVFYGLYIAGVLFFAVRPGLEAGSLGRASVLALAYCVGLGLPFVLAAFGFGWMTQTIAFFKRHIRVVNLIGGGLLILIGLLMVTGIWSQIMFSLQAVMANFGTIL